MTQNTDFQKRVSRSGNFSVTIANGGTTSNQFDLQGTQLFGIEIPAAFTAGSLTFKKLNLDGKTFSTVNDLNQATYTIAVTQGNYYPIDQTIFAGVDIFKIVCSASQGAARTINLVQAPLFLA